MATTTSRESTDADRPFVEQLNYAAYRDVVTAQFGWDAEDQERRFAEKWATKRYRILCHAGADVGALCVTRHEDHLSLDEILVAPEHQSRGLGTSAIRELLGMATAEGLAIRLQVLHANRAAELYERLGFRKVGSNETHIAMEWKPDTG